jgi:ankyrin repeat protein
MIKNLELFNLIKNNRWDEFIKECNERLDYNIRDEQGNFLIQYIILYNKIDILKIILQYNIKLDFLDNEGKSILYLCIKYNYMEIIKILISKTNNTIGIPLVNIMDKSNMYPLHYTILFQNIEIFEYLIEISNLYIYDKHKNSLYHHLIKNKYKLFLEKFIKKNININLLNLNFETATHLACLFNNTEIINILLEKKPDINIRNKDAKLTPFMITIYNNNNEIFEKMLLLEPNLNLQNKNGETGLHIAIIENNFRIIDLIINNNKCKINYNLVNINGSTPLHLILNQIKKKINIENYNIEKFIKNTNLNIQDTEGNTCWHLLVILNIYDKYKNILKRKKNNIFILNKNNISAYQLCNDFERDKLLKIIENSFRNNLKKSEKNKWILKWQNKCSQNKINKKKCNKLIKNYIISNNISIPIKRKKYIIDIQLSIKKQYSFFTGITFDIITSYLYILKKYPLITSSITNNFINNSNIIKHYQKMGFIKDFNIEYLNFEIIWSFQQIFFPSNIDDIINNFINNNNKIILIIPIGIELNNGAHSNVIIIDKYFKIIERFEPNGSDEPYDFNYNSALLDYTLKNYFEKYFIYNYYEPKKYLPTISLQTLESYESHLNKKIGDPGGFCVVWCVWYVEQRIKYRIHPKKLIYKLLNNIKIKNLSFKNLIRSYSNEILTIRDSILDIVLIDINDIINNNYKNKDVAYINEILSNNIEQLN